MNRPANPSADQPRRVTCPTCGGDSIYAPSNPYRPFCSERCKKRDFGAWASEDFRMPAEAPPDDQEFGDPKLQ
ncbi:MAG: DNA gyrase inhibitor YacG [Hylemonella sp.]|nr:DNA gyrase inhibitor YacG [Hylemonella sp.]